MTTLKTNAVSVRVEPRIKEAHPMASKRELPHLVSMVVTTVLAYWWRDTLPFLRVPDESLLAAKSGQALL